MTLEETMLELSKYGAPHLYEGNFAKDKWRCMVEMRVNATGVTFDVKAGGDTPLEAAKACHSNMQAAIASINGVAKSGQAMIVGVKP